MASARIPLDDELRERIKSARRARGLSQAAFGAALGSSKMTVVRIEGGHRPDRKDDLRRIELEEIARLTGQPLDYFTAPAEASQLDRIEAMLEEVLAAIRPPAEAESPAEAARAPKLRRPASIPQEKPAPRKRQAGS